LQSDHQKLHFQHCIYANINHVAEMQHKIDILIYHNAAISECRKHCKKMVNKKELCYVTLATLSHDVAFCSNLLRKLWLS